MRNTAEEIYRKSQLLTVCTYNNEIYVPQEVIDIYKNINSNKLIKVDGKFYTKINENDLENIKNAYRRRGIDIEKKIQEIIPIKK